MLAFVCFVIVILLSMMIASINREHRAETGVNLPTRAQAKRIRRTARQKGISEADAFEQWHTRRVKQAAKQNTADLIPLDISAPSTARPSMPSHLKTITISPGARVVSDINGLKISLVDLTPGPENPDNFYMNFEFVCSDCGGFNLRTEVSDDKADASCAACGAFFGKYGMVRERCEDLGRDYLRRNQLGAYGRGR